MDGEARVLELGGTKVPWLSSHDTNLESSELVSGGESGFMMIEGAWRNSGPAGDVIPSGSPVSSSIATEGPASSKLSSLDLVMRSGSKTRAEVGVANPWKIKSPRISPT